MEPTVQTDRTVPNNKPEITVSDNEKGTCVFIDVEMSGDRNVTNPLNTKRRLLYLKAQFVPRSKHFSYQL